MTTPLRKIEKQETDDSSYKSFLKHRNISRERRMLEVKIFFVLILGVFIPVQIFIFERKAGDAIVLVSFILVALNIAFICSRKYTKSISGEILFCNLLIFLVMLIEFSVSVLDNQAWDRPKGVFLGYLICLISSLSILSRLKWAQVLTIYLAIFLYSGLRFNAFTNEAGRQIAGLFSSCVMTSIFSAVQVAFEQSNEYKQYVLEVRHHRGLKSYKVLLKKFLPESILIFDLKSMESGTFLFINNNAKNIFGKTNSEVFNSVMNEIMLSESHENEEHHDHYSISLKESILEFLNGMTASKKMISLRAVGIYSSKSAAYNSKQHFNIKLGEIKWEGNDNAFMMILSDVTREKKISEMEMADLNKDRILATVTHDLRTPINAIIGILESIVLMDIGKKATKLLNIAITSAKNLLFLVNDILDYSQINKGVLSLNMERFILDHLIKNVIGLFKFQMKKKGLKLIFENNCGTNLALYADPLRVQQILCNLIGNAYKFTKEGHIRISVSPIVNNAGVSLDYDSIKESPLDSKNSNHDRLNTENQCLIPSLNRNLTSVESNLNLFGNTIIKFVKITVEDTGYGIKEDQISSLFEPFGKLPQDDESINKNGIGLGLAISQRLAIMMSPLAQGIKVVSKFGKGSKFSFVLETWESKILNFNWNSEDTRERLIGEQINQIRSNTKSFNQFTSSFFSARHILLVDDDEFNILVLSSHLKKLLGYSFEIARNGADAIEYVQALDAQKSKLDLILMDINMPIMDGVTATRILTQRMKENEIRKVPIVILTADKTEAEQKRCFEAGCLDVVNKPVTYEEICALLEKLLN